MYNLTYDVSQKLDKGQKPSPYVIIKTTMGWRLYSGKQMADDFYPSSSIIDRQSKLVSISEHERTIQPQKSEVFASFQNKQKHRVNITLSNTDNYFSKLLPFDPFINMIAELWVGFDEMPVADQIPRFAGKIVVINIGPKKIRLSCDEF